MNHATLAANAVNSIGRDLVLTSTYQNPDDMCARLLAGVFADHFEAEADAYRRVGWHEAARRAEDAAEEFARMAVYEDVDTVAAHRADVDRYGAR